MTAIFEFAAIKGASFSRSHAEGPPTIFASPFCGGAG
jgi:hypothetical protein